MLATLRIPAVLLGVGAGALAATVVALTAEALGQSVTNQLGAGLVPGIFTGFLVGGYVSGRLAVISHRFHGAVTGLGLAAVVVFIARSGGSPANILQVLYLAVLGMAMAGLTGWLAGRRRRSPSATSHSG